MVMGRMDAQKTKNFSFNVFSFLRKRKKENSKEESTIKKRNVKKVSNRDEWTYCDRNTFNILL